jgi:multidrug efflux system membrane fusion protein
MHKHPNSLVVTSSSIARAGLALAATALLLQGCGKSVAAPDDRPLAVRVSVAPAVQRRIRDSEDFSGRLEATAFVELRPRVTGTIDKVHFVDGALVRQGDLLFSIDPRPFQAELARAEAQVVAARAKHVLAQSEFARADMLAAQQAASKEEVDLLLSGSQSSGAEQQSAEAALRVAQLNLGYTQVRAPISGRVSRASFTAGNLVNDQTILTSIAGVSQVYAYFDGSEQTYLALQSAKSGAERPRLQLGLSNEHGFPHTGDLDFVDNRLNPQTGAVRMRARFDNAAGLFTPGLAARLHLEFPVSYEAVMVADRAIGTDQTKKYVYVVTADGQPQLREIEPGTLVDGMRAVRGNLAAGENVVVDGLQRIQPGARVSAEVLATDARGMPVASPPAAPSAPAAKA